MTSQYTKILEKFKKENLNFILIRYPYIIKREITDLDILFKTKEEYNKAIKILKNEEYDIIDNERYRTFLIKKENDELLVFDIYHEVSWLGWVLLNKDNLFKRKEYINKEPVFSKEDELLIYVGQGLFKNFGYDEYKSNVITKLQEEKLDYTYINKQLDDNGWKKEFYNVINKNKLTFNFSKTKSTSNLISIAFKKSFHKRIFIILRLIRLFLRKFKKHSTVICLIGVDGSGKSTTTKTLEERYKVFFDKFHYKTKQFYFGWKPFLPTTKILSYLFKKKKYKIVNSMNIKKEQKFNIMQELIMLYYWIEYIAKYYINIFPRRNRKEIIFIDRYFYDSYAHYKYATKSVILKILLKFYPKPDYTFVLDADPETINKRKKELTVEELKLHKTRYLSLAHILNLDILDTTKSKEFCANQILNKTYQTIIDRIK